jgi:cell wall-associated NlpC family hydrolase
MPTTPQISGTAVAVATAGAVLIYAGFRGLNPLQAVREVASGRLSPLPETSAGLDTSAAAPTGIVSAATSGVGAAATQSVVGGRLVAEAMKNAGDRYSMLRRWSPGYSDCSSFVGKALRQMGITPPAASVTGSYLAWGGARKIDRSSVAIGDLIVNTNHMIIATSNTDGIGQQNSRDNVKTGKIESLMWGTGTFTCLRIVAVK